MKLFLEDTLHLSRVGLLDVKIFSVIAFVNQL